MNDGLKDFGEFLEEVQTAHQSDMAARRSGVTLITLRESGIFMPPGTSASVMNKKIVRKPTLSEWEAQSMALQAHLAATTIDLRKPEKPKAEKAKTPFTMKLST